MRYLPEEEGLEPSTDWSCNIYTCLEQNTGICVNWLRMDYKELKN